MKDIDQPVYINHAAANCTLGNKLTDISDKLFSVDQQCQFLTLSDEYSPGKSLPLGLVNAPLDAVKIASENSRNNRLLTSAVTPLMRPIRQLQERYGSHRIGMVIGTSTSGIAEAEAAMLIDSGELAFQTDYRYSQQEFSAPVRYLAQALGLNGPAWVVSTACTSGGKALASAARLLKLGVCDAVIAGGVDTLCRMTVAGFSSLQVISESHCNPFSIHRNGINIGEAAALFVLSREEGPVRLAGYGETSDAYHISSPDPQGRGAASAMQLALKRSNLKPDCVDYINLHGTATAQNDRMEAQVVNRIFGEDIPCSSTKPLTGHTLAAAGALEALFCWLLLQRRNGKMPLHMWDGCCDPELARLNGLQCQQLPAPANYAMSNSFAFGGNNLSLILARE